MELGRSLLEADVEGGNVGMVLEHAADLDLTPEELKKALVTALNNRAKQKEEEANKVDTSWGIAGRGSFERNRAKNLRKLAKRISDL